MTLNIWLSERGDEQPKKVEQIQREINRLTLTRRIEEIVRKIGTNRETTQYLLITNLSDALRDYLLNKRMGGVRLTVDDHNILLRIMSSLQHEYIVGMFSAVFLGAVAITGLPIPTLSWKDLDHSWFPVHRAWIHSPELP